MAGSLCQLHRHRSSDRLGMVGRKPAIFGELWSFAGSSILEQPGEVVWRAIQSVEQLMVQCPYRGLGTIARRDLSEDRLDVGFHGRFGDFEESRNVLVGIP